MPPRTTLDRAYHFGMFMTETVEAGVAEMLGHILPDRRIAQVGLDGRVTELVDLARVNLLR